MRDSETQNLTSGQRNHKRVWALRLLLICMTGCLVMTGCTLRPKALNKDTVWNEAEKDLHALSKDQEAIKHPISLYEAIARAIKYNREYRLKLMQSALSMHQRDLSAFDLLPDLTASAGYVGRDNASASSSESYRTGLQSLEPSISEDRYRNTADTTFTWSVLDFGLSYVRAKQQSDSYLMAREVERKTVQNIASDVRLAWWQALSAQQMLGSIDPLMQQVEEALEASRRIEGQRLEAPLNALAYQRGLLDMMRTLESLRKELSQAKPRLASLMGLSFTNNFTLAVPDAPQVPPQIAWDVAMMEKIALLSRPELMESRYQNRISREQTRAAMLGLLPNLNLNTGWNWDSNSYLVNNSWLDFGSQVSWNLMNIFKAPATMRTAKAEEEVAEQRRLAMSMTVLMQVHLAKVNYLQSLRQFNVENAAFSVEDRILQQIAAAHLSDSEGKQALIREQLNYLLAQMRRDKVHAELQNSLGMMLVSMGIDPVPATLDSISVQGLAEAIEKCMTNWQANSLEEVKGINIFLPTALLPVTESQGQSQPEQVSEQSAKAEVHSEGVAAKQNTVDLKGSRAAITANYLNFRKDPALDAEIIAIKSVKGEEFPLLDHKNGWAKLDLQGTIGWVSDAYITAIAE